MTIHHFDIAVQLEGAIIGERYWTGEQIHTSWNVENMNTSERSEWGLNADNYLQYRSMFSSYSMRYNSLDVSLEDYYFETEMRPAGTGNYEAGVMFRFKDRGNFYFLTYNGGYQDWGGNNLRLMKQSGTSTFKLAEYAIPVFNTSMFYKLRVEVSGGHIQIWLDGTQVFDYIDSYPILKGAFGPIVKGQEFATWKGFQARSTTGFLLHKAGTNYSVDKNYDPESSTLVFPETVGQFMQDKIDEFLVGKDYTDINYRKFTLSNTNEKVITIFDQTSSKKTTADETSRIYAYQIMPTSPPLPVTDLQGSPIDHQSLRLQWTHPDDSEDGFRIIDENGSTVGTVGYNVGEFIEEGLAQGVTYKRRVVAYNVAGYAEPSNEVVITTSETIAVAPSGFKGTALSDNQIKWEWIDNSNNESEFELLSIDELGNVTVIAVIAKNETSYIEENLNAVTEYTRAIRAKNSAGVSESSESVTATTMDLMPEYPMYAPVNFTGVGLSDESILWSWEDINDNEEGFRVYDENNQIVQELLAADTYFIETNLASKMPYRRRVVAFNRAGEGPSTDFAWAKTLDYGQDQTGTPLEPMNLTVTEITKYSAELNWDYTAHHLLPAVGFKIYNENDVLIDSVPVGTQKRVIQNLNPDTTYRMYVVAYNEAGDSLPSNLAVWVTDPVEEQERAVDLVIPDEFIDPWHTVSYDTETEDTPKIEAFHAGVGDNLDLVVRNRHDLHANSEDFIYEMYIKGRYTIKGIDYPKVPFSYQLEITGVYENGDPYTQTTEWETDHVRSEESTEGIRFDNIINYEPIPVDVHVEDTGFVVTVLDEEENEIAEYDPEGTNSGDLYWIFEQRKIKENVGFVEEIEMKNVYDEWQKFSHGNWGGTTTVQPSDPSELTAWKYDVDTDEIISTVNSDSFHGAVSPDAYSNFEITARMRSNGVDNDRFAFVLAFAVDETGYEHTLSAVRSHTDGTWDWAVYYNYLQSDQIQLGSKDIDATDGYWYNYYPDGVWMHLLREDNQFTVKTSQAGLSTIEESSEIIFTLDDDPHLEIFKGAQQIGVAAHSQPSAALKIISFSGEKIRTFHENYLTVWTNRKEDVYEEHDWIGATMTSNVETIDANGVTEIEGRIQSPAYQIPWQEINNEHEFIENAYQLILTSQNANVELALDREISDFFPTSSTFITVPFKARVINPSQTKWHPSIHSGYYYLNQREYFLYSDDRVLARDVAETKEYIYSFPYIIRAYGERYYSGGEALFVDETSHHYSLGEVDGNIKPLILENKMTLKKGSSQGVFISRLFDFGSAVETWNDPIVIQDLSAIEDGANLIIEVGEADELGVVEEWKTPSEMHKAKRMRYRLTFEEGYRHDAYTAFFNQENHILQEGRMTDVKIEGESVSIIDPEFYKEGTFITKPINFGENIDDMGFVELNYDGVGRIELYSVSANSALHTFHIPTSENPWIPLRLVAQSGTYRKYKVDSAIRTHLAIVVRLFREDGGTAETRVSPVVSTISIQPTLFHKTRVVPTVDSVTVGGYIPSGYWVEEYAVPRMGEVVADQNNHPITERTTEEIVHEYLASIGVYDPHSLVFKDYVAEADPIYPVELSTDRYGKTKVQAKTTVETGDIKYRQERLYFDAESKSIILTPVPQNGSPIVVKNAQGKVLRPVHFRDSQGRPTIANREDLWTNATRFLFLQHREHEIDARTLKVFADLNNTGGWVEIFNSALSENRLILKNSYMPDTPIRVYYQLKDSYVVDYNFDPTGDAAKITVNTSFHADFKETRQLMVKYEVNKDHAYYVAKEVNLNPLHSKINAGFIYLSDTYYPPYKMDIRMHPNTLYRNKKDRATVHVYVYDENDNPSVDERVVWEANEGTLHTMVSSTDENGMVTAIYEAPSDTSIEKATITATVLGRNYKHHLDKQIVVNFIDETFEEKITIVPEKDIVQSEDIVQLKVIVVGPTNERLAAKNITVTSSQGMLLPSTGVTDHRGEMFIEYHHPTVATNDYVIIEASDVNGTKEQILLGTSGV